MFTINGKEYNPVLSARACVTIEDKLGKNPLSIFSTGQPKITDLLIVFGGALGLDDEATYDLFDEYMKENSMKDFTDLILNIFKESGFIGEKDSKNPKKAKGK